MTAGVIYCHAYWPSLKPPMKRSSAMNLPRILTCTLALAAAFAATVVTAQQSTSPVTDAPMLEGLTAQLHDFDFFVGNWRVHHRLLKARLANSHEWVEFDGTINNRPLMGGYANVDETVFEKPEGAYMGVALRSFDTKTRQW